MELYRGRRRAVPRAKLGSRVGRAACCLLALVCTGLGWVRSAHAETCGSEQRPWLGVEFAWQGALTELEGAIVKDLRAGFATRGIDVCAKSDGPAQPPAAWVRLQATDAQLVNVEVLDTVTQKSVSRDMNLNRVPKDGRAFAIAVGTDELVWASWAELAFERSQRRPQAPPPEVTRGVREDLPNQPKPESVQLLARGAFEWFSGGQAFWGGDAGVLWPVSPYLDLQLVLGVREGLEVNAPDGRITSNALSGQASAELLFVRTDALRAGVLLGVRLARLRMQGAPSEDATASVLERSIVVLGTGLGLHLHLAGPVWLGTGVGAGLPLRGVEATDTGEVVSGATGVELAARLGVGVSF